MTRLAAVLHEGAPDQQHAGCARPWPRGDVEAAADAARAGPFSSTAAWCAATAAAARSGIPTANVAPWQRDPARRRASTPAGSGGGPRRPAPARGRQPRPPADLRRAEPHGSRRTSWTSTATSTSGALRVGSSRRACATSRTFSGRGGPGRRRSRRTWTRRAARSGRPGSGRVIVAADPMSELHGRNPGCRRRHPPLSAGFINAHTVRLFEGEIQKALAAAALQDRRELRGPLLHRERRPRGDHGRDRGDPRATAATSGSPSLNETVQNIFEILGFNHLYRIFPSEVEAILSFRPAEGAGA